MGIIVLQRLLLDALLDLVYFPVWWFTAGAKHVLLWCIQLVVKGNRTLAPGLWLINIFVPMYGQYDWQGRIVSFFMRLIQVVFRSLALVFWILFCLSLFFGWLSLPILILMALL